MKKKILIAIATPIVAFILLMAYRSTHDLYANYKASDQYVANFCGHATSTELTCYCYNSFARTCPLDER